MTRSNGLRPARASGLRMVGWLAVAAMLGVALIGPSASSALALTGAVYTSNFDGSIINENTGYASKSEVYLTGGPCQGGSHLAAGDYYFEVDSPNGVLLSSDAIGQRLFTVGANGFISSTAGSHATVAVNCTQPVSGFTIQLIPYANTPNAGGEYKLIVASAESVEDCNGFDATDVEFQICNQADQKSDNYKVGAEVITEPPVTEPPVTEPPVTEPPVTEPPVTEPPVTEPPVTEPPVTEPPVTEPPSPSFTGGVEELTGTPAPVATLPPTDGIGAASQPASDTWRMLLVVMAALLASILVLTPSRSSFRR